jgi:hypothetical protein
VGSSPLRVAVQHLKDQAFPNDDIMKVRGAQGLACCRLGALRCAGRRRQLGWCGGGGDPAAMMGALRWRLCGGIALLLCPSTCRGCCAR